MHAPNRSVPPSELMLTSGGPGIFVRIWQPHEPPRAILAICHGLNSHGGQYQWVAEQMTAHGMAVYALDLRGRGRSEGERFYVETVDDYVADLAAMIDLARSREGALPIYLLGHSVGGVVSSIYTLAHQAQLAVFICESFAFQVPAPDIALSILKGISYIAPHAHVLRLKNEDFSRDPDVVARLNGDPLIKDEAQPSQTVAALVRADERLKREFPLVRLPLLILHGTADRATMATGSERFFREAGSQDKSLKLYDGHYHDLLSDLGKEMVLKDIQDWIDSRLDPGNARSSPELPSG